MNIFKFNWSQFIDVPIHLGWGNPYYFAAWISIKFFPVRKFPKLYFLNLCGSVMCPKEVFFTEHFFCLRDSCIGVCGNQSQNEKVKLLLPASFDIGVVGYGSVRCNFCRELNFARGNIFSRHISDAIFGVQWR